MYLFYPSLDFQEGNIWRSIGHDRHHFVNSFGVEVVGIDFCNDFCAFPRQERFCWLLCNGTWARRPNFSKNQRVVSGVFYFKNRFDDFTFINRAGIENRAFENHTGLGTDFHCFVVFASKEQ